MHFDGPLLVTSPKTWGAQINAEVPGFWQKLLNASHLRILSSVEASASNANLTGINFGAGNFGKWLLGNCFQTREDGLFLPIKNRLNYKAHFA